MCNRPPYGESNSDILKRCTVCGRIYRQSGWYRLDLVGFQTSEDIDGEMRNCSCDNTLFLVTRRSEFALQHFNSRKER